MKCESCRAIVFRKDLEENCLVLPEMPVSLPGECEEALELLLDGKWTEHDAGMVSTDPLKFLWTQALFQAD